MREIITGSQASPLVRVFATTFRLAQLKPAGASLIEQVSGSVFSLQSAKGPQAVTVAIDADTIELADGVSRAADVTLTLDFDNPGARPSIRGLWRHPLLTYRVGQLLSLPLPNWADSAKRFWAAIDGQPHLPHELIITCTDEDRSLRFGEGSSSFEIHGPARKLESLLVGQSLLVQDAMSGDIRIRGSLKHLAGLSGAGQKLMLGELDR